MLNLRRHLSLRDRPFLILAVLLALSQGWAGCSRIPRQRTLPPSIRSITVPMFVNRTPEPQIEAEATRLTQEEFLADGRLNLVGLREADAVVRVTLSEYGTEATAFDEDDFPRASLLRVRASVDIVRNTPDQVSIGGERKVEAVAYTNVDPRRANYEPEPVGRERVLRELGRQIVREVMTGELP